MVLASIYGLFDPRLPDIIFYVGKGGPLRVKQHWRIFLRDGSAVNALLRRKFKSLVKDGVVPSFRFLEENVSNWQEAERRYIASWKELNPELCNVAPGGNSYPEADPETIKQYGRLGGIALRGNLSQEARLKMSLAKKGKPSPRKGATVSAESRLKMSLAKLGKKKGPLSEEHRLKISLSNLGKVHNITSEGREGLRSGGEYWKGRQRPIETRQRMSHRWHRVELKDSCKLCQEELSTVAYG